MDWGGIPWRVWLASAALGVFGALLVVLGVTNSYDSIMGLWWQVKARVVTLTSERDNYKAQAESYAEQLSQCEEQHTTDAATIRDLREQLRNANATAAMWRNRAEQLEQRSRPG